MSGASSPVSMMTPESENGSLAPSSPRLESQDSRIIIRRLLLRYGRHEIERLLEEESCEPSLYGHQPSSLAYEGNFAPVVSENIPPGMANTAASVVSYPGVSSGPRQRVFSGLAGGPGPLFSVAAGGSRPSGRLSSSSSYRMDYACGFCAEIGITKTCTRRNDLRRHIDQFHNTNAQWLCQHPGCRMAFDWQTAYQIHLRNEHGGSQMRMEEAKVVLCPQTVFACGHEGCHHVLEAANDSTAPATWKAYTAHLIKHCEEGRAGSAGSWDYSHRMRNLLNQSRVAAAWKSSGAEEAGPAPLRWDPGASRTLRKLLETRHLDNLPRLLGLVVLLGSPGPDAPKHIHAKLDLDLPVKKLCPAAAIKHEMRNSPPPHPETLPRQGLGLDAADLYKMSGTEMSPYHGVADSPRPHPTPSMPFRTSAGPDAYSVCNNDDQDHSKNSGGNDGHAVDTPMTPPQGFYGMLAPPVYPQQYVAFRPPTGPGRPADSCAVPPSHPVATEQSIVLGGGAAAAIPRAHHHDGWAEVYGSTGLQSPALTDAYYDVGSPMASGHQNMLGTYVPPPS
ncbi:zinc finger domain-containing protein [Hirsutella rhossiliensis]|uniref:Zinc finger domain-containing protein n=1 Tax=Hirsutella rhossiliensis TaxID=111463 RepID=A0A9P8N684_9HYPO|nr:zinc finger domain-containing protein [Hirsutella rhossiliensis]KAH0968398.1 zinc finger domain-containing protein [Hirsutella rhossiliensis]